MNTIPAPEKPAGWQGTTNTRAWLSVRDARTDVPVSWCAQGKEREACSGAGAGADRFYINYIIKGELACKDI